VNDRLSEFHSFWMRGKGRVARSYFYVGGEGISKCAGTKLINGSS